ncbi:MAG: GatB/YqeY domain-containing protein [Bacilli bacterium]|nr:GatB/YqeY domain-containing protein [Bacilli bacterium]MDD4795046.1 GatB/YqeY domain-containing protein [Bacilli bacterium]
MLDKLNADLTAALKAGEKFKLSVLRMLKSEIKNAEINKRDALDETELLSIIKKQVKVRKDSREEYLSYNREDLADNLAKEIDILSKYLPEELTDEELSKIVDDIILEEKPTDIKQMGTIIKLVQTKYGARADMKKVSNLVRDALSKL